MNKLFQDETVEKVAGISNTSDKLNKHLICFIL